MWYIQKSPKYILFPPSKLSMIFFDTRQSPTCDRMHHEHYYKYVTLYVLGICNLYYLHTYIPGAHPGGAGGGAFAPPPLLIFRPPLAYLFQLKFDLSMHNVKILKAQY